MLYPGTASPSVSVVCIPDSPSDCGVAEVADVADVVELAEVADVASSFPQPASAAPIRVIPKIRQTIFFLIFIRFLLHRRILLYIQNNLHFAESTMPKTHI